MLMAATGFSFAGPAVTIGLMEATDTERRREAWSSYWAAGGLHSCIGRLVDDREGAIGRFWRRCFASLRSDDRVLDLATGNGALPKLLRDTAGCRLRVDAVDLADVSPRWRAPDADDGIVFHSRVRMEELPFADGAFDLVVSQFGLEYARWPEALEEAARVCRAGSRLAFVMHHADSLIVRMGRIEQAHQEFLLASGGLLEVAAGFIPHLARVQAGAVPDDRANRARFAYNEAMRQIAERIHAEGSAQLLVEAREQVHGIVGGRFGGDAAHRSMLLTAYTRALADAAVRTRELLACALDRPRADVLAESMRSRRPGGAVEAMPLVQDEDIVAWGITVD